MSKYPEMLSRRVIYSLLYGTAVLLSFGCSAQEKKDVYRKVPLGSPLTLGLLKSCEQVVPNGADLILVYNISEQWDYFDPHLLFFDDSLKLYSACYFPSERIESVEENVITGYLNAARNERRGWYRNDLPEKYRLNLISSNNLNGSMREGNKVVGKIELDSTGSFVTLHVMKSEKRFITVGRTASYSDAAFLQNFTLPDTLKLGLPELRFDYAGNRISTRQLNAGNRLVSDYMLVPEKSVLDDFYRDLFIKLGR